MTNTEALKFVANEYERKLEELLGKEEFEKYMRSVARKLMKKDIKEMPDGEFKDFMKNLFKMGK